MQAIFSAKLFRASTRQAAIRAALENPVNQELVLQLKKYLDPESVEEVPVEPTVQLDADAEAAPVDTVDEQAAAPEDTAASEASAVSDDDGNTDDTASSTSTSKQVVDVAKITKTAGEPSGDTSEQGLDAEDDETDSSDDIASSSAVGSTNVTAACNVFAVPSLDTIQGQLNSVEDTCGVVRTKQSGDELWVYFSDKKNLNNLMDAVIDRLAAAGFYQLEFNRLARTDNAIVFEIVNTTSEVDDGQTKKTS